MIYTSALEKLIDDQHGQHVASAERYSWDSMSRAEWADNDRQVQIARAVGIIIAREFGELISWDVFDNCREYGLTVTTHGGWQFCVFEHRNSDEICIQGCPLSQVRHYGPYGDADKYDVLARARYQDYEHAAAQLIAIIKASVELSSFGRSELKHIASTTFARIGR